MDSNRKKYVGREFLQRLADAVNATGTVQAIVTDLARGPTDVRIDVARGLLAIGSDRLESVFRRKYALNILPTITRTCALSNNEEIREQLNGIIDAPLNRSKHDIALVNAESPSDVENSERIQKSALTALGAVE